MVDRGYDHGPPSTTHDPTQMKYSIITFGCRVNQADSLSIEGQLRARGGIAVAVEDADVVVVNTCSVTASADQGARQTIRRIARGNPDVRIVVTGCYASRQPDDVAGLPNVTHVVGNSGKDTLVSDFADEIGLTTVERFGDGDGACGASLTPGAAGRTAFTLRVQTGCDEQCSYCIIPKTRGHGRSRPLPQVLRDIALATEAGYKEIAITGVHLGSYGRDLGDGSSLTTLVRALTDYADHKGSRRIPEQEAHRVLFRISSLEPMDCTPEVVDLVASSDSLAPHFHLPLQHGSDRLLAAMRRPYTAAQYTALVDRIHRRMPHASIGSDIIVGFPGERDEDMAEMRSVLASLPLSHLHVFPYSDRPGTEASLMRDKVEGRTVRERGHGVRAVGEQMTRRFRESQVGTTRHALTVDDGWSAVTDNYIKVRLERQHERNEWIAVDL
jgi:threonylcarbamoyladenosine tRNA methylthiotransferase MtaB